MASLVLGTSISPKLGMTDTPLNTADRTPPDPRLFGTPPDPRLFGTWPVDVRALHTLNQRVKLELENQTRKDSMKRRLLKHMKVCVKDDCRICIKVYSRIRKFYGAHDALRKQPGASVGAGMSTTEQEAALRKQLGASVGAGMSTEHEAAMCLLQLHGRHK